MNCICIDRHWLQSVAGVEKSSARSKYFVRGMEMRCVHGDMLPYPLAMVKVVVDG